MRESTLHMMKAKIERLEMVVMVCLERIERLETLTRVDADISPGSGEG